MNMIQKLLLDLLKVYLIVIKDHIIQEKNIDLEKILNDLINGNMLIKHLKNVEENLIIVQKHFIL